MINPFFKFFKFFFSGTKLSKDNMYKLVNVYYKTKPQKKKKKIKKK